MADPRDRRPNHRTILADIMAQQGRRSDWLGHQLGLSRAMMTRILLQERGCRPEHAEQIARILGVPLAVFFRDGKLVVAEDTTPMAEVAGG
jgi:hypothetical protein